MNSLLLRSENAFVVCSLIIFTGAWILILFANGQMDPEQGFAQVQAFFFCIYSITFCLIALRWKKFIFALTRGDLCFILAALALSSVLWSNEPAITFRRSFAMFGTTLFGVYFATRYSLKEQLQLLAQALGIAAMSSLLYTLAFPGSGTMAGFMGAWRGVFVQKNVLGIVMVLSTLVFLILASSSRKHRVLLWSGVSLSVALVLLSASKNALVLSLILLALFPLYRALRWNFSRMLLLYIAIVIVFGSLGIWIFSNWEAVLGALGKDATLTGRTAIWSAVMDKIQERPWLGYGYSGFWQGIHGENSSHVWYVAHWDAPYSHNGFLDLLLDLGLLGLIIYLVGFAIACIQAVTLVCQTKSANSFWPLIFLTFAFLSNFSDSTILKQNSIFWVLYVATTVSLSLGTTEDSEALNSSWQLSKN